MIPLLLCNLINTASSHSRNAYSTWSKESKLFLLNLFSDCRVGNRKYRSWKAANRFYQKKQHVFHQFSNSSLNYIYLLFKHNCACSFQPGFSNQKRHSSSSYRKFRKSTTLSFTLLPSKLIQKLKLFYSRKASKVGYLSSGSEFSSQHHHNFPYFFNKETSFTSASYLLNSKSNELLKPQEKTSDAEKVDDAQSSKESIKPEIETENNGISDAVNEEEKHSSNVPVKRSQYEHFVETLSSKEVETVAEEGSSLGALRSLVEVPVTGFFSFFSRLSLFEKTNAKDSGNETDLSAGTVKSNEDEKAKEEEQTVEPPKSILEILYQYVPYTFQSSTTKSIKTNDAKEDLESVQLRETRLKAEKELLHQKININNRTRYLLRAINESVSLFNLMQHVEELKDHLLRFPDARITAVKENGIQDLMHLYRTTHDEDLIRSSRMVLAMLGAVDPPKMKGIRLLTIDGGGSRGIAAIEICRRLVELTGRPINEMFDYVCGVSTGAILCYALGILKMPLDELAPLYRDMSTDIFNQNRFVGTGNLVLSHAYYNTDAYQKTMKKIFGNQLLIETAAIEDVPKCSAVSTLVNRLPLKPFLWRNYSIVPGTRHTHWNGTCRATMWEAVRASSAAPGYFEEFKKGYNIHQDGGVLTNNPTGVALNECRLLWPHAPIQCVVSVGTGRYEPVVGPIGEDFSSLKDKLLKFVDSATNVTEVHKVMYDLLPPRTYFRFNPFLDEPLLLDEYRPEKMDMLVENTLKYVERNEYKFRACARVLLNKKL